MGAGLWLVFLVHLGLGLRLGLGLGWVRFGPGTQLDPQCGKGELVVVTLSLLPSVSTRVNFEGSHFECHAKIKFVLFWRY